MKDLTSQENKVYTELFLKKKTCDRQWDRVFLNALHGEIDKEALVYAIGQCNDADYMMLEFQRLTVKIKKGKEGLTDEEYHKKYIAPYSQSKVL